MLEATSEPHANTKSQKFWFFFSKKNRFLSVQETPPGDAASQGEDDQWFHGRAGAAERQSPACAERPGEAQAARREHVRRQMREIANGQSRYRALPVARVQEQGDEGEDRDRGVGEAAMAEGRGDGCRD